MKGAEEKMRKHQSRRTDQCLIILLEARARECMVVASRKAQRKRALADTEEHGMKMPESLSYDPKPLRTTRDQGEARLTPGGGPLPVMACPVG